MFWERTTCKDSFENYYLTGRTFENPDQTAPTGFTLLVSEGLKPMALPYNSMLFRVQKYILLYI